LTKAVNLSL